MYAGMSVDSVIRDLTSKSDLPLASGPYAEIANAFTRQGIDFAFFVFTSRANSSCARTVSGVTTCQPTLEVYLKYNAELLATGVDPNDSNWSDKWAHTTTARNAANQVLRREGFGDDFVSEHTFIFLRSLERVAFQHIGCECREAVQDFIRTEAPGATVSRVFWNGREYFAVMSDKDGYRRAKRAVKAKAASVLRRILSDADPGSYCKSYDADLAFGVSGMDLFHVMREDVCP